MSTKYIHRLLDDYLHVLITKGNHEAFEELKKRYHRHALVLVNNLLTQYVNTGVTKKELLSICDNYFHHTVIKFVSGMSSFYNYWKENTTQRAIDYLVENSYGGESSMFCGTISLNQSTDGRYCFDDILAEKDVDWKLNRKIFEIRALLARNEKAFESREKAIIELTLVGYSLSDLEATGLYGKTQLHLTFNNAAKKLKKVAEQEAKNKKQYSKTTK